MLDSHYDVLINDVTLTNLLEGGIYDQAIHNEISKIDTPDAFDPATEELLPCALFKVSIGVPVPNVYQGATRTELEVYLYQRNQYTVVQQAASRIYQLWHDQIIVPTNPDHQVWRTLFLNEVPNGKEDVLRCNVHLVRYNVYWHRFGAVSNCGE
jgi:hypothetical protein